MNFFKRLFSAADNAQPTRENIFSEGNIFYTYYDQQYHLQKLLVFEEEFNACHVLIYQPLVALPDKAALDSLTVAVYHTPIAKNGFKNPVFLAASAVTAHDLIGYHEYPAANAQPRLLHTPGARLLPPSYATN